jgi:hypothetical protein
MLLVTPANCYSSATIRGKSFHIWRVISPGARFGPKLRELHPRLWCPAFHCASRMSSPAPKKRGRKTKALEPDEHRIIDLYEAAFPDWNRTNLDTTLLEALPRWENDRKGLSKQLNNRVVAAEKGISMLLVIFSPRPSAPAIFPRTHTHSCRSKHSSTNVPTHRCKVRPRECPPSAGRSHSDAAQSPRLCSSPS